MKQLIILAGGKGTRLRERLGNLPKPLIDICGVPLLERQILLAKKYGFNKVLILVNHQAEQILDFCTAKQNWGLQIDCLDDGEPRGTAGATLAVFDRLDGEFLVMYGDTMMEVDLSRFHSFHAQDPGAAATLFLHPNDHPHDSDLVELGEDLCVTQFYPYPHESTRFYPNLVNAALYWFRKTSLVPWRDNNKLFDFGKDLFPAMLQAGLRLRGYNSPEYIKDAGTPQRVDKVCADFLSGRIEKSSFDHLQSGIFLDRDGTINREVDHLNSPDQFELLPGVASAIRELNRAQYRCCVITNQPVIARGECTVEVLRQIHNKMETLLGREGAFVDRIYFCPHHPDSGFPGERAELKIRCDCRKPGTGMIDLAITELNLARGSSWLIGDTSTDIETAHRAGLKSILVETGYAGLDHREWAIPDATVPDMPAAANYILDTYPRLLSICDQIAKSLHAGAIVLIGGQARSGKTTFANVLRDAIHNRGDRAVVLSVDRWLRSAIDRDSGVLGRYDMCALQKLVVELSDGDRRPLRLRVSGYNKLKRKIVADVRSITILADEITILEGTVALGLSPAQGIEFHKFHIESDETSRRERVLREYLLRGAAAREAMSLYLARMDDEFPVIERMAASARRVSIPFP